MPAYAPYELDQADALCDAAGEASLTVVVQTRMDHAGRHHPLARVKAVDLEQVVALAERHPQTTVIIGGLSHFDLPAALVAMAKLPNLYADTSQLDGFDTLHDACANEYPHAILAAERLLFASHAPLFVGWSALARIVNDLPADTARQILAGNAVKLGC